MTDCQAAAEIVGRNPLWRDRYHYEVEQAARDLLYATSHGDYVIGAFAPALLGFAWLLPQAGFGRSPYLRLIATDPKAQSAGAGKALLGEAEAHFQATAKHLFLLVSDFNTRAKAFYTRCGYARVGALADYVLPGVTEEVWMKRLSRPKE